jgi:TPR repeat protein
MKALLSIVLLLAFGVCVCWSNTPEEIAQLKEAAEQGDVEAQFNLGFAYAYGRGVPEDDAEAVKWWKLYCETNP